MTDTFLSACLDAYQREQDFIERNTRLAFLGMFGVEPDKVKGKSCFVNNFRMEYEKSSLGYSMQLHESFKIFWICPSCGQETDCKINVSTAYSMGKFIMENLPKCTYKKCRSKQ